MFSLTLHLRVEHVGVVCKCKEAKGTVKVKGKDNIAGEKIDDGVDEHGAQESKN